MKLFWTLLRVKWLRLALLLAGFSLAGCSSSSEDILFSDNPAPPPAVAGSEAGTGTTGTPSANNTSGDLTAARFHVGDVVTVDYSGTVTPIPENIQTITEDGTISL